MILAIYVDRLQSQQIIVETDLSQAQPSLIINYRIPVVFVESPGHLQRDCHFAEK